MKPLVFSQKASSDLIAIADYIREDNPTRAQSYVEELISVCAEIPAMPKRFPVRPRLGKGMRVALHGRYMIFFRELPDEIRIERILHGARDLVRAFKE